MGSKKYLFIDFGQGDRRILQAPVKVENSNVCRLINKRIKMNKLLSSIKSRFFHCEHKAKCSSMNGSLAERVAVLMKIGNVALAKKQLPGESDAGGDAYLTMFDSLYAEFTEIMQAREQNILKCPLSDELKVSLAELRYVVVSLQRDVVSFETIIGVLGSEAIHDSPPA